MRRALRYNYLGEIIKQNTTGCLQGETVTKRHHTVHWEEHRGKMGRGQRRVWCLHCVYSVFHTPPPSPTYRDPPQPSRLGYNITAQGFTDSQLPSRSIRSLCISVTLPLNGPCQPCLILLCVPRNIKYSTPSNDNCFCLFK